MFKRRSYKLEAIFIDCPMGGQIFREPTTVLASSWDVIFFTFSPTCKPAPLTLPVYTLNDHFFQTPTTLTLLPSSLRGCYSTSVSMETFLLSTVSTPAAYSRVWFFAQNSSCSARMPSWPTLLMKMLIAFLRYIACPLEVLGNFLRGLYRGSLLLQCLNILMGSVGGWRMEWSTEFSKLQRAQYGSSAASALSIAGTRYLTSYIIKSLGTPAVGGADRGGGGNSGLLMGTCSH